MCRAVVECSVTLQNTIRNSDAYVEQLVLFRYLYLILGRDPAVLNMLKSQRDTFLILHSEQPNVSLENKLCP